MLFQEIIEFFMAHITNPNKENAIRMPLAFIPEAEAGVIEDADAKFHNVDVRLEAPRVDQINLSNQLDRAVQFRDQDSEILFVEEFFRIYFAKPVKATI